MCIIMYKPCILFALCICLLNLLRCWDIHSRADIQMIFLCLKPVCNVCPPFWLSQAWGACTFCSTIFSQCTRAPPVQTLLLLPLTICESLKRWHPGSWFKWFKALARTQNWIPSGEHFATSSNHCNLHFRGLCWRLLKSGTLLVVLGINFSTAFFFSFFFPFVWFSLFFCYIFWDLKVLLSPCTAGVGSCRGQITVHFFLGQQWLTGCRGALIARCLFSLTLEKSSPPLVQCSFWLDLLPQSWWELRQDGLAWSQEQSARKEACG